MVIKQSTYSFCPHCLTIVQAKIYVEDGRVLMEKDCPEHGKFIHIIEKDPDLYMRLCHRNVNKIHPKEINKCLVIPVEYRCNLDCIFCALPHREKKNFSIDEIKRFVSNFKGRYIELSGGEPTMREDIFEIIRVVKSIGKKCHLVTNGLRLIDRGFVEKLKAAGMDFIFFSLYGTSMEVEKRICGADVLERKLAAIRVIKDAGIPLGISMTIVPGINDNQIRNVASLAAKERITFLTFRSCTRVGKYPFEEQFFLSDLLNAIQKELGIRRQDLLSTMSRRATPYFMYVYLRVVDGRIFCAPDLLHSNVRLVMKMAAELGGWKSFPPLAQKLFASKDFGHWIRVRIASWPDKYNVDLEEIKLGKYFHVYNRKKYVNLFEALILNEGL